MQLSSWKHFKEYTCSKIIPWKAVDCGSPTSNLTNLKQVYVTGTQPGLTTYQSTSAVVCIPGWIWSDGSAGSKTITCAATASWSTFSTCTSILIYSFWWW